MYTPLCVRTHYSLRTSIIQPGQLSDRLKELNLQGCAITDYGSVSGAIQFHQKMEESGLKPILGVELNISGQHSQLHEQSNRPTYGLTLLAKNLSGWNALVKIVSVCNREENYYYKPRIDLEQLSSYIKKGDVVAYSGQSGSLIEHMLELNSELGQQWTGLLKELFGKENVYFAIDLTSSKMGEIRELAARTGTSTFGYPNPHYCRQSDSILHRIVLCNEFNTTLKRGYDHPFFKSDRYFLPSYEEMAKIFSKEELENTNKIAAEIEKFKVSRPPIFPAFSSPNNQTPDQYLREICREGWKKKIETKIAKDKQSEYIERIKHELEVLQGAGLSSYFLVLRDILNFVKSDGKSIIGVGRGSVGGCLTAYLSEITKVDPIPYNLQFERFYNAGRNSPGKVSFPDIDVDIPIERREATIEYIKQKYGEKKVAQIMSLQTIKGRGALKMVFRAYDDVSFDEQNKVTEHIIEESKIADELQELKEAGEEPSILGWSLENRAEKLSDWVKIDDDGNVQGPLSMHFEKAIKLEKTKSAVSKHAAGVIVCGQELEDLCPMIYDSQTNSQIVGYEMNDAELVGLIKMDILGLATLDRLMTVRDILANGEITI